jgi:hypothetical protein
MLSSQYLLDIIKLLIDENGYQSLIMQLPLIEESKYEYSGIGVFVSFYANAEAPNYKLNEGKIILDGVLIKSPELHEEGAEAILHINDGIMDYLEIWCYDGVYPEKKELREYTLTQIWKGSEHKMIKKE